MKIKKICSAALKAATALLAVALCIAAILVMAVNFTLAYKSGRQPGKVPSFCGYMPLIADDNSMNGSLNIKSGDLILIIEADAGCLRTGDVIAFYCDDGSVTTHRIVRLEANSNGETVFRTKGDAPRSVDDLDLVSKKDVIGIYRGKISGAGSAVARLKGSAAAVAFVLLPLAAMVAFQIVVWFAMSKVKALRGHPIADKPLMPEPEEKPEESADAADEKPEEAENTDNEKSTDSE